MKDTATIPCLILSPSHIVPRSRLNPPRRADDASNIQIQNIRHEAVDLPEKGLYARPGEFKFLGQRVCPILCLHLA